MANWRFINLNEVLSNEIIYEKTKSKLKEFIMNEFNGRKNTIDVIVNDEKIEMSLGLLLINLILLRYVVALGRSVSKDDLFMEDKMTQKLLEKYLNKINDSVDISEYDKVREIIAKILDEAADISGAVNVKRGNTISYRDFIRISVETPEVGKSLFRPEVKSGQFHDIEKQFNAKAKEQMTYFSTHKESELYPFAVSGTGLNTKQLCQCIGFVGLKPDMDGSVIPVIIKENFLNGLQGLESYYINSKGTRKSLVTNKTMTKKSGYLTRKLSLSNIDHFHDNSIEDCGTKHFVLYYVDSEKKKKQILNRHYYELDDSGAKISDELKTVTSSSDIVGKVIGLRSPVTCCGKHVCATCYGKRLSEVNKDVNTGLVAVLKLTEPLTQKLLSAKHLLSTKTDKVEWSEEFLEAFTVNMDSLYFSDEEFNITFKKPGTDDFDEEEEKYFTETIQIQRVGMKKAVEIQSPVKLFINPELLPVEKMKDDDTEISLNSKTVCEDKYVFKFQVKNNELTKSLQQILDLIESNSHLGIKNYHDFVNKFVDLLIENEMDYIDSVHPEMLAAVLIRDEITGKRLDFSKEKLNPYIIYRVSKSVMSAPLAVSLAFERINDQLVDANTYEKDEVSMMDNLFR